MTRQFKVKYFPRGEWDGNDERTVTAHNSRAAAEKVCGVGLTAEGKGKQLRAKVRPAGMKPVKRDCFYEKT